MSAAATAARCLGVMAKRMHSMDSCSLLYTELSEAGAVNHSLWHRFPVDEVFAKQWQAMQSRFSMRHLPGQDRPSGLREARCL